MIDVPALPSLHHTEMGATDGLTVLAVHGWGPDHRLMAGCLEPVFERRRAAYRRLYPDLPGMGMTPADGVTCADDVLDALCAYIDHHVGRRPFLVAGESYGGYLARALASRYRDQVQGLALICPVGRAVRHAERTVPEHRVLVRDLALPTEGSEFADVAVVQTPETYARTQDEVVVGLQVADSEALARIQRHWELSKHPESESSFDRPTVVLTGRQDSSTGYADVWPLVDDYPRATFAVLDTAGHNLQIEQPQLFDALVQEWLDRVEREAAG